MGRAFAPRPVAALRPLPHSNFHFALRGQNPQSPLAMKIALDAMGGDFGPPNLVSGAVMALREYPHINKLFLVGDTAQIEAELKKHNCNDGRIDIVHAT